MTLDRSPRRPWGLVALGLLVAFKSWLLPLAVCLPVKGVSIVDSRPHRGRRSGRHIRPGRMCLLGRCSVLVDWLFEALPANAAQSVDIPGTRSWTMLAGPSVTVLFFLGTAARAPGSGEDCHVPPGRCWHGSPS